jgi:lipopolysaccharide transport system ATP-binding protein
MIEILNLTKEFKIYKSRLAKLKEIFGFARNGKDYDIYRALSNISLNISKGSVHGVLGLNGAGKSTLLKILTGVLLPTSGNYKFSGRVAALLELGTGFHGELTGRENVALASELAGLSALEIQKKIVEVQQFSELGDFFDRPVKIYSSGMYVRLAFSFSISVSPDILIIDEALSVGDAIFQQKCINKIKELKNSGVTILFVSHDIGAIKYLCDSCSILSKGELIYSGELIKSLEVYNALLAQKDKVGHETANLLASGVGGVNSGTLEIEIISASMLNSEKNSQEIFGNQKEITLCIEARNHTRTTHNISCGFVIRNSLGVDIFGTNSFLVNQKASQIEAGAVLKFSFTILPQLAPGLYNVGIALHEGATHIDKNFHWKEQALFFKVLNESSYEFVGQVCLPCRCEVS